MRNHIVSATLLALALAACGGSAEASLTDDTGAETVEAITAEAADAEAAADVKADRAGLTTTQETTVLKSIDDACGDSWCEGDFNYKFKHMSCDFGAKRCTFTANVITSDNKTYPRACRMTGITGYSYMIQMAGNYPSLTDKFYTKVSTCIDKWTPTIPQ